MTRSRFRLCGLTVEADLPLPAPPAGSGPPDLVLTRLKDRAVADDTPPGELVVEAERGGQRLWTGVQDERGHLLRFQRTCEFRIDHGLGTVTCVKSPEVDDELVSLLAAGTLMAYLLALRGRPTLHGAAVEVGGRAVALLGHSQSGKSTTAALLCAAGGRLLADDVLLLDVGDEDVQVQGSTQTLRLRSSAWDLLDLFGGSVARNPTIDGRLAFTPPGRADDPAPLAAIVLPQPIREPGPVQVTRVDPAVALVQLGGFHRVGGLRPSALLRDQFRLQADLATRVPLYTAHVPWGPPFTRDLADELLAAVPWEAA